MTRLIILKGALAVQSIFYGDISWSDPSTFSLNPLFLDECSAIELMVEEDRGSFGILDARKP